MGTPTLQQIIDCQNSPWDFGNGILYKLCAENFFHQDKEKVIAKVWLIGRSYATAIERRRNKETIKDDFYIDHVAPDRVDKEYGKFACKCLALKMLINKEYGIDLKPRHLDNILIKIANQNLNISL